MNSCSPGDIVWGKYPYSDKSKEEKPRFFLVIASFRFYVWGVMLTSKFNKNDPNLYEINNLDLESQLPEQTYIKLSIIQTLDNKKVERVYTRCNPSSFNKIKELVKKLLQ